MSGATDLTVTVPPSIAITRRQAFDAEQVALIRATVAADCNDAELALFLETCVRHELDPFIKEVWAIRWKRGNPVQTVVSKEGFLKIANRTTGPGWMGQSGEFLGVTSGVLHEHDIYDVDRSMREDGTEAVTVTHKPRDAAGKATFDLKARGQIIGAWGRARRRGHDDYYFEASADEYNKKQNAWESHPHAMMSKVAESIVLRKAYPIAGVVGEGELERLDRPALTQTDPEKTDETRWPDDEDLTKRLQDGFRALGYRRAKVRALVNACETAEDYAELLGRLNIEADQVAEDPNIEDAEVIHP